MIGKQISIILESIEDYILEHEAFNGAKPEYSLLGFRAATKIFMSALMDKMYELQMKEDISEDDCIKMAEKAGNELRNFVKTYTDIDTVKLYEIKEDDEN